MSRAPILDSTFLWNSAASHSDPSKFRSRMAERRRKAQSKPVATVTAIKPPKSETRK